MDSGERGTQQPGSLQLVPQFVVLIIRGWLGHWDLRISELEDTMMCGIIRYHLYYLSGCRKSDVQVRHLPHFSCAPEILDPLKASERISGFLSITQSMLLAVFSGKSVEKHRFLPECLY